jgi:hypothetical protein
LYLTKSVASWQAIFGKVIDLPSFEGAHTCSDFARLVKNFLGRDVSDIPREQLSFQSIKKGLPASCVCMENGLLDKLVRVIGSPPSELPKGYLDFVRRQTADLFKKGWDASYESFCLTTTPPLSSVAVFDPSRPSAGSRSSGGCLGQCGSEQDAFLDAVLHGEGDLGSVKGKLLVVQSAGKPRPLSKFCASTLALKPLHKTLYGSLKKFRWLLTGDPTAEKLRRAGFRFGGGDLVSGDYASATDGLSIEVAQAILETAFSSSIMIPENVKRFALLALRPVLGWDLDEVSVSTGQMMGSYLSFPLLCLQNYLAFRWSLRGTKEAWKVPVLINGDDILFQKSGHFDKWCASIQSVGLTVERTKTSVENDWGTINSTLLEWDQESLRPFWSARFGMFRPADHPGSLGKSFLSFLSGLTEPSLRFSAGREWFRWHLGELRSSGVSPVSLGFRGLLSRRLSKLFSLLELPLVEFPRAYDKHSVGYDADFITRHDACALGPEELFQSSLELGAQKWADGWKPIEIDQSCFKYCRSRSECKGRRFDYPCIPDWVFSNENRFRFCLRNQFASVGPKPVSAKAFLSPFPEQTETLVSWSVLDSLRLDYQEQSGWLPPYGWE